MHISSDMAKQFPHHSVETAPAEAQQTLRNLGDREAIPKLLGHMAESPPLLGGYIDLFRRFANCSLDAAEQQIVLLTASVENECHYCVAGHTPAARQAGLSANAVEALRDGRPLPQPKQEALRRFTQAMVISRAFVGDAVLQQFLDAGFTPRSVLDVVLGIAVKTMSNYTNHLVDTALDDSSKAHAWEPPSVRSAA